MMYHLYHYVQLFYCLLINISSCRDAYMACMKQESWQITFYYYYGQAPVPPDILLHMTELQLCVI